MRRTVLLVVLCGLVVVWGVSAMMGRGGPSVPAISNVPAVNGELPLELFDALLSHDPQIFEPALARVARDWRDGHAVMMLEICRVRTGRNHVRALLDLVRRRAEGAEGRDADALFRWCWARKPALHSRYAEFKGRLYGRVDARFATHFAQAEGARIRLDEIRWGGVRRDQIPPLKDPKVIPAAEASYLDDGDVVFGLVVNGDARCYPKRILAWHEMFKQTVGGTPICGVYCTLCGMMIAYEAVADGVHHELGTSGFLYRSNKLMYDHATESLWSTVRGEPVVGSLVGRGIRLAVHPVVTTTWGEWRRRHAKTTVLSLETGHDRNYGEGVAYREYFATDKLMFSVPKTDTRLANKAEVLALRIGDAPLAISAARLAREPVFAGEHGGTRYVVLTDAGGGNRVYAAGSVRFAGRADPVGDVLRDASGAEWRVGAAALSGPDGARCERLPAHRAFWFGWHAAHPDTELIR